MKKLLSALLVLLLLTLSVPAFAGQTRHPTPAGYNDHDYQKCADFLDTQISVSFFGQTMTRAIWEWFQFVNSSFNINDPSTWHVSYDGTDQFYTQWEEAGGEQRLVTVWTDPTITSFTGYQGGGLDLAGCTELRTLVANVFRLTELSVNGCEKLEHLECRNNYTLASVDLTGCASLSELDLTGCPLAEIDLSDSPLIPFDMICANGSGTVYYANGSAYAVPDSGKEFFGWYAPNGQLITGAAALAAEDSAYARVTARFTGAVVSVLGDADGNGEVVLTDALIVLRAAMGIIPITDELASSCDVDFSGNITVADAVRILRFALGIIPEL